MIHFCVLSYIKWARKNLICHDRYIYITTCSIPSQITMRRSIIFEDNPHFRHAYTPEIGLELHAWPPYVALGGTMNATQVSNSALLPLPESNTFPNTCGHMGKRASSERFCHKNVSRGNYQKIQHGCNTGRKTQLWNIAHRKRRVHSYFRYVNRHDRIYTSANANIHCDLDRGV